MTIHFIYVKGNGIGTPYAITNELANRLSKKYNVIVYDWSEATTIYPVPGDILIGHPHPLSNTVYRRSFFNPGWSKRILLCPFAHKMPEYIAFLDPLVCQSDKYIAICGPYWIRTIEDSLFSHWREKIERIDLAVRRDHFPYIKTIFNPAGNRKFVSIGRQGLNKGSDYLAKLAEALPNLSFSWIGGDQSNSPNIKALGALDFSKKESLQTLAKFDFVIQCGRSDANPTTLLEGASVGLVPLCTPQSGYDDSPWIINFPLDDIDGAAKILNELNNLEEKELAILQTKAQFALDQHYTWDRFAEQLINTIEENKVRQEIKLNHQSISAKSKLLELSNKFEYSLKQQARIEKLRSLPKKIVKKLLCWR